MKREQGCPSAGTGSGLTGGELLELEGTFNFGCQCQKNQALLVPLAGLVGLLWWWRCGLTSSYQVFRNNV